MFKEILAAIEGIPAKISALFGDIKAMSEQFATANATIAERDTTLSAKDAEIAKLTADLANLANVQASLDTANAEIVKLKLSAQTVEQRATEQVAALGIDPLPAAGASEKQTDQRAALRARLIKSTDPIERAALSRQLRDLK